EIAPNSSGKRGLVQLTTQTSAISALALRFNGPAFTNLPVTSVGSAPVPVQQFALTMATAGTGNGKISASSNASSINCGANCLTFASGSVVTMTATPSPGSTFVGWYGACSGIG